MNVNRRAASSARRELRSGTSSPQVYVFCEKQTGTAHFQVCADAEGHMPLEEAASLLAMHCLVRGESPSDYEVMVRAGGTLFERVTAKARQLLDAGRAISCPVGLSRREKEVLDGVLGNLANKEIANRLSISERTVKFHVSSLFVKFKVRSRMELLRKTPSFLSGGKSIFGADAAAKAAAPATPELVPAASATAMDRRAARVMRIPPRLLTA